MSDTAPADDGRLRKGARRRRELLDATMRVIERAGVAAVSQRVVAAEAGVPASAVTYHFPTVDALLVGAMTDINDRWLAALDECAASSDPLAALAALIAGTAGTPASAAAEYELFVRAARDDACRAQYRRWVDGLDRFLVALVPEPTRRAATSALIDGLMARACGLPDDTTVVDVGAALGAVVGRRRHGS